MANDASSNGPDPIDVQVGIRVRDLRKDRGLSQTVLGDAIGVTFQQVQKYERGTNRISASMLVKTAGVLNVAPSALLPGESAPTPRSPTVLSLIAQMRGVEELVETYARIDSPHLRRTVLQLARSLAEHATRSAALESRRSRGAP